MEVIKRDGKKVNFDVSKIRNAISGANARTKEMTESDIERITEIVVNKCNKQINELDVEVIQDLVEDSLLKSKFNKTAKSFILYRDERNRIREGKSKLIKEVGAKLLGLKIDNQNANVDEMSFGGRKGEATNVLVKQYALNYGMSKKAKENHLNNEIYIHDLDSYAVGQHNCLSIPFDYLLSHGFTTRQTDVRPANSINTACQLVAVIFQLQSLQQFGGVSATHLDFTLAPYVKKSFKKHFTDGLKYVENVNVEEKAYNNTLSIVDDKYKAHTKAYEYAYDMTVKELKQAVEGLYHNLNTLQSRSGNQLPFTSINYGLDTSVEGRLIIKALLEGSINGTGKYHRTPIFPCGIFQVKKNINLYPGTPNYDLYQLALESTAKRLYPNYANCDWSNQKSWEEQDVKDRQAYIDSLSTADYNKLYARLSEDTKGAKQLGLTLTDQHKIEAISLADNPNVFFSTMGCRTANGSDCWFIDEYALNIKREINGEPLDPLVISEAQKDGRGNICPVTIILPTLAMEANRDKDAFMKLLDKKIHEAKDMLLERFNYICSQSPDSAKFMYENNTMMGFHAEQGVISAIRHGTIVIGQLGIAETLQLLIGKDQTSEDGLQLAKEIEQLYNKRCAEFKKQYKLNFGVYYTPAESLCYTAMTKFKKKYGIIPRVSDHEYFTNSMHVPVYDHLNAFEKIDIESQLTGYSNAGCITYVELASSARNNIKALEKIVTYAMEHDIPYFALNSDNNLCENCGYQGTDLEDVCPVCGSKNIQQLKRVTGYLTGNFRTAFNYGKQKEVEDRTKHTDINVED